MGVYGGYDYWNMAGFPKFILQHFEAEGIYRVLLNGPEVKPEHLPAIKRFFIAG